VRAPRVAIQAVHAVLWHDGDVADVAIYVVAVLLSRDEAEREIERGSRPT
jgi:hypothetical protein